MIRTLALSAGFLAALVLPALGARPAAADSGIAEVDRQFTCPEALASDAARMAELKGFMDAVTKAAPVKHGCAKTLDNLNRAAQAVANGDVERQAWLPIDDQPTLQVFIASDFLKPFLDPRRPADAAVETYAKVMFKAPHETNVTHVTYDEVISHNVYYCRGHGFALIENDYFLQGKPVLKDPSPVDQTLAGTRLYEIEPIHDQTPNAVAAHWACGALKGAVALGGGAAPRVGRG